MSQKQLASKNRNAKLSVEDIYEIHRLYKKGCRLYGSVASEVMTTKPTTVPLHIRHKQVYRREHELIARGEDFLKDV